MADEAQLDSYSVPIRKKALMELSSQFNQDKSMK